MRWITTKMKWIMLVSGILTCTMIYAAVAPQAALQQMFGGALHGPLAEIVVRNWGILITLIGGMLIYGAFRPVYRPLILVVAVLGKLAFIGLVVFYGTRYLHGQAGIAVIFDSVMVILYTIYLMSNHGRPAASDQ